jgi:hypothetical protein
LVRDRHPGRPAGRITWVKDVLAVVLDRRLAGHDVDELILLLVPVAFRGLCAGLQGLEIRAVLRQSARVGEVTPFLFPTGRLSATRSVLPDDQGSPSLDRIRYRGLRTG